jgi:hypothetical protein
MKLIDYEAMSKTHDSLRRGMVWCRHCGHSQQVDAAFCLQHGWPKHCGYTMTIDHPDTWAPPPAPANDRQGHASEIEDDCA